MLADLFTFLGVLSYLHLILSSPLPSHRPPPPHPLALSTEPRRLFQNHGHNPNPPILPTFPGIISDYNTSSPSNITRRLPSITHVHDGIFYDENNNQRIFRGLAISYKTYPYLPDLKTFHPVLSFNKDDLRLFDKLNLNIIRLGISWSAAQPQKGSRGFNEHYLSQIKHLVIEAEKHGIYVLLDCHQDLFAEGFMGDGFPNWAITKDFNTLPFPLPMKPMIARYNESEKGPENMKYTDDWGWFYGSDSVTRAFWGLYTNYDGVQDEFIRFWSKIAETFKGMSNVIGYELINEPFIAARSTLNIPLSWILRDQTETYYLQPMYDAIISSIRRHDPSTLIFWEPVCGSGGSLGGGFTRVPGNDEGRSVLSFHSYGPNLVDGLFIHQAIEKAQKQVRRLGGGVMLTEWDVEASWGEERMRYVMELADESKLSWIGWQYKQFVKVAGSPSYGSLVDPNTGEYRSNLCQLFSRPYPSSVKGELISYNFDWDKRLLYVNMIPEKFAGEIVVSVTEETAWGWEGQWSVVSATRESGELQLKRVETEEEKDAIEKGLDRGEGRRDEVWWWIEQGWVEGSKRVIVRLGGSVSGSPVEVVIGMI